MLEVMRWPPRTPSGDLVAVDQVRREQAAEEHDLGDQEHPHAERRRLGLLRQVVEMVRSLGWCERGRARRRPSPPVSPAGVQRTRIVLGVPVRQCRPPRWARTGACRASRPASSAKFSVGGGDGVSHSSPRAPHGFVAGALRRRSATTGQIDQRHEIADRQDRRAGASTARSAPGTPADTRGSAAACPGSRATNCGKNVRLKPMKTISAANLAQRLGVHPAGHLRPPVVQAAEVAR